jgi:protein-disulfide isomerase
LLDLFRNKLLLGALVADCLILLATLWRQPEENKLADIDGAVINERQVEATLRRQLSQLHQQIYNLKWQKLNQLIDAQLVTEEAKRRGVSVATLLEQDVEGKVPLVSEEEIRAFYESNKNRLNVELDKVHDKIRDHLNQNHQETRKKEFFKTLRAKAKVTTYLKPPPPLRVDVPINGAPIRGAGKGRVTIVKFEDYQCPYCKTVQPTFLELLKRYDGKIKLVHKDLPLDEIHPQARPAAEAAGCAGDQGKFWDYHDKLYAQSPKFAVEDLKSAAKEVGLNLASFEQCFTSGKFKGAVQKDLNDGVNLGLTGTPAFFINGREISGAQPIDAFAAIIDEELAQTR